MRHLSGYTVARDHRARQPVMLSDTVPALAVVSLSSPYADETISRFERQNMHFNLRSFALFLLLAGIAAGSACAQPAIQPNSTSPRFLPRPSLHRQFNAERPEAYMAMDPSRRHSALQPYFEGGYWLVLWDFLSPPPSIFCFCKRVVGPYARFGCAHLPLQAAADLPLFRTVHRCHLRVRLSA